jgi:PAS domain S-box-containing protein
MLGLVLLVVILWILSLFVLLLHYDSPRFGLAPFVLMIGGLTALLQAQLGVYIEPSPGFILFVSSNVLVPIVLMSVLILYIVNGTLTCRVMIYAIVGVELLVMMLLLIYRLYLTLPEGGSIMGTGVEALLLNINPRTMIGSVAAFAADMFVIAIVYQGAKNYAHGIPDVVAVGLALLVALWTDAIVFRIVADLGTQGFIAFLPGDLLGKTATAFVLWPVAAFYVTRMAPRMPNFAGVQNRRTFDLLFGSFHETRVALLQTEAALEKSEAERRKEEDYFRQILENISEASWLAELDQKVLFYVNPAYEEIWGRSANSLYADPEAFPNSIHPDDRERIMSNLPTQVMGNYDVEYRIFRPDGAVRWVRDRAFPIPNDTGEIYRIAGIAEDITERKLMEKQSMELALEREKVKVLHDFIHETSHDLKTPLSLINLKIYHLRRTDEAEKREALHDEIIQLSNRMGKMIDDLLTLSRLENVNDMAQAKVDINQIIREIDKTLRPLADNKGLTFGLELDGAALETQGNPDDLTRALGNLIDNAIYYTPNGGHIRAQTEAKNEEVVIRIIDNGIGISQEDQLRIFERFFRASNAREVDITGTGLGLAIVKRIIERHHGRIEVASQLGRGTTFTIYLPTSTS